MIGANSNNKATGSTGKACDAGTPISGKNPTTNEYSILATSPTGMLLTGGTYPTAIPYLLLNPQTIIQTGGALAAGTFLGSMSLGTSLSTGVYRINPFFGYTAGAAGGGISFLLYQTGGTMDAYVSGLANNNPFVPSLGALAGGVAGIWHNTANQQLGSGTTYFAYNRNNTQELLISAGQYGLVIFTDGTVNISAGSNSIAGFLEFMAVA